jgi:hypothetical protein
MARFKKKELSLLDSIEQESSSIFFNTSETADNSADYLIVPIRQMTDSQIQTMFYERMRLLCAWIPVGNTYIGLYFCVDTVENIYTSLMEEDHDFGAAPTNVDVRARAETFNSSLWNLKYIDCIELSEDYLTSDPAPELEEYINYWGLERVDDIENMDRGPEYACYLWDYDGVGNPYRKIFQTYYEPNSDRYIRSVKDVFSRRYNGYKLNPDYERQSYSEYIKPYLQEKLEIVKEEIVEEDKSPAKKPGKKILPIYYNAFARANEYPESSFGYDSDVYVGYFGKIAIMLPQTFAINFTLTYKMIKKTRRNAIIVISPTEQVNQKIGALGIRVTINQLRGSYVFELFNNQAFNPADNIKQVQMSWLDTKKGLKSNLKWAGNEKYWYKSRYSKLNIPFKLPMWIWDKTHRSWISDRVLRGKMDVQPFIPVGIPAQSDAPDDIFI